MGAIKSYRDLLAWQRSVELVVSSYTVTKRLPDSERFGLASQIQRAAVSIAANIAEGHGRSGPREFLHFLSHARGSMRELETLVIIANRVGYIDNETHRALLSLADEVGRLTYRLSIKIAASRARGSPEPSDLGPQT